MHFCFAESLQSALVGLKASGTPNKAAAQLAKPGLEPLVACIYSGWEGKHARVIYYIRRHGGYISQDI